MWCEGCGEHFDSDHYANGEHGVGKEYGPYGELLEKAQRCITVENFLIEAMCKLHEHVIHAGTDFEEEALSLFGVKKPDDISGYGKAWQELSRMSQQRHVARLLRRWNSED